MKELRLLESILSEVKTEPFWVNSWELRKTFPSHGIHLSAFALKELEELSYLVDNLKAANDWSSIYLPTLEFLEYKPSTKYPGYGSWLIRFRE